MTSDGTHTGWALVCLHKRISLLLFAHGCKRSTNWPGRIHVLHKVQMQAPLLSASSGARLVLRSQARWRRRSTAG